MFVCDCPKSLAAQYPVIRVILITFDGERGWHEPTGETSIVVCPYCDKVLRGVEIL